MATFISDQARVGDEGQGGSSSDDIGYFLPKQVGEIAEGAEDGKAGDKRRQAVGDADEEHVEDDVLAKASLFPMNTKHFATLWNLLKLARVSMVALPALREKRIQIQRGLEP